MKVFSVIVILFFSLLLVISAGNVPKPVTVKTQLQVNDPDPNNTQVIKVPGKDGKPVEVIVKKPKKL
jgi:hypothetical protein